MSFARKSGRAIRSTLSSLGNYRPNLSFLDDRHRSNSFSLASEREFNYQ
jgi:hypothetical protein